MAGFLVIVLLLLIFRALFFFGPILSPEPLPESGILDIHCHVAGMDESSSGCFVSDSLKKSYKFGIYLRSFGVTRKELEKEGDGLLVKRIAEEIRESKYVEAAVILAIDGVVTDGDFDRQASEFFVPNDFVVRETAEYPELLFGASVNPYRTDSLERLEKVVGQGAVLMKWLPSIQRIDPSDRSLIPFYEKLVEHNLPLICHTGQERSFTHSDDSLADPKRLRLPLETGVRVIAAHAASTGENENQPDIERLIEMMREFPNLYADISSLTQVNKPGYLKRVLTNSVFSGRLLYGSDYPLVNTLLVHPVVHSMRLKWSQVSQLMQTENTWDRDVLLKHYLGVPTQIFEKSWGFIRSTSPD
jgi:predicted TIM-barrel fold metal-dependent hydrolase